MHVCREPLETGWLLISIVACASNSHLASSAPSSFKVMAHREYCTAPGSVYGRWLCLLHTVKLLPAGLWAGGGALAAGCGCHWGMLALWLPFGPPLMPPKAGKLSGCNKVAKPLECFFCQAISSRHSLARKLAKSRSLGCATRPERLLY